MSIVLISTGPWRVFLEPALASIRRNLLPGRNRRIVLFTDDVTNVDPDVVGFQIPHLDWPYNTLFRYHYIRAALDGLPPEDLVVYIDADMMVATEVGAAELLPAGKTYFGVQHPHFGWSEGPFEANPGSAAWVDRAHADITEYWQACFWGGRARETTTMVRRLADGVAQDVDNGLVAVWHDESHLNRYFIEHKDDVHTLPPSFAFPEGEERKYSPRILHVSKSEDEFPLRPGPSSFWIDAPPVPSPITLR
ncbi:hypothetical protein AB0M54_47155 [Actinoplanes sp. NPDC051470]|uniref:hypothetical protein n=1 Tax=Actinoplanes sp. NPDC051470 TaxID=3157224 RepID=UPI00341336EE